MIQAQLKVDTAIEYREKPEFHSLRHKCSADVYLSQGNSQIIRIEADSAIINRLRTDIVKESLLIWTQTNIEKAICLNAYITARDIKLIEASGLGSLINTDTLFADTLTLITKFFGGMTLNINCNHLILEMDGSAPVTISGKAKSCEIKHNSAPLLNASALETEKCTLSITKNGVARVNVAKELKAEISGSGGIYYLGNPEILSKKVTASGFVINLK